MYTVAVRPSCCLHVSEGEVDKVFGVQGSAGSRRDGVNSEPYWWVAPTKKSGPEPSPSNRLSGGINLPDPVNTDYFEFHRAAADWGLFLHWEAV